jgi:hypothetical protein
MCWGGVKTAALTGRAEPGTAGAWPITRDRDRRPERCPLAGLEARRSPARRHDPSPNPAPGDPRHVSSARGLTATQPFQL